MLTIPTSHNYDEKKCSNDIINLLNGTNIYGTNNL